VKMWNDDDERSKMRKKNLNIFLYELFYSGWGAFGDFLKKKYFP
jgi:hypothetical protein